MRYNNWVDILYIMSMLQYLYDIGVSLDPIYDDIYDLNMDVNWWVEFIAHFPPSNDVQLSQALVHIDYDIRVLNILLTGTDPPIDPNGVLAGLGGCTILHKLLRNYNRSIRERDSESELISEQQIKFMLINGAEPTVKDDNGLSVLDIDDFGIVREYIRELNRERVYAIWSYMKDSSLGDPVLARDMIKRLQ
jgi:hypothetical protein